MIITRANITNECEIQDGEYKTVIKKIEEKFIKSKYGKDIKVLEFQLSIFVDDETIVNKNILHFVKKDNEDYKNFVNSLFENYSTEELDFDNHVNTVVLATIFKNDSGYYVLKSYKPYIQSTTRRLNVSDDSDLSDLTLEDED